MLCDYGCGQEATYQFKNGKWCCSKVTQKCPGIKEKISKNNQGKIAWNKGLVGLLGTKGFTGHTHTKKTKKIISKTHKNKIVTIETKQKMINNHKGMINKKHSFKSKRKISESLKGRVCSRRTKELIRISNIGKNKNKNVSKETRKKISITMRSSINNIKKKYPTFALIEKMRYEPGKEDEKIIQVHCKNHNCINSKEKGGWFTIKNYDQLSNRIYNIEKENGYDAGYFYCSKKCKQECPLYGAHTNTLIKQDLINAGHIEDPWYTTQEYQEWRKYIFELDGNKCVYCGEKATIAHHILPQKTHPELSLDPENGLSCCIDCHYKYGHRDSWCTTGKLGALVCERIIKMKNK